VSDACILCAGVCVTGESAWELSTDTGDAGNIGEGSKLEKGELLLGKDVIGRDGDKDVTRHILIISVFFN
jgi:hypothetical protein